MRIIQTLLGSLWVNGVRFMSITADILLFALIALFIGLFIQAVLRRKKETKQPKRLSRDIVNQYLEGFGGSANVVEASQDGTRLKVTLADYTLLDEDKIRALGVTNLFISGNKVKMTCPVDMSALVESLRPTEKERFE